MDNEENLNQNTLSYKELIYFKEEIYHSLKELEKKIIEKLNDQIQFFNEKTEEVDKKLGEYKTQTKIYLTKEEFEEEKKEIINKINKKKSYEEKFTSYEIQIDAIRKDLTDSCFKYDKIFIDQLTLPGIIGDGCKFKSIKDYIKQNIEDLSVINNTNQKTLSDIRINRAKFENRIKEFNYQIENVKQTLNHNLNLRIAQFEEKLNERFVPIEGDIKKLMNDINLPENRKKEKENMKNIKKEIFDKINENHEKNKKSESNFMKEVDVLKLDLKNIKKAVYDFSKILSKNYEDGNLNYLRENKRKTIRPTRRASVMNDIPDNYNFLLNDNKCEKRKSKNLKIVENPINTSKNDNNNIENNNKVIEIIHLFNQKENNILENNAVKRKSLKNNLLILDNKTSSTERTQNIDFNTIDIRTNKPILRLSTIRKKNSVDNNEFKSENSIKNNDTNKISISIKNIDEDKDKNLTLDLDKNKEEVSKEKKVIDKINNEIIQSSTTKSLVLNNISNINYTNNNRNIENKSNEQEKTENSNSAKFRKITINEKENNNNIKHETKTIRKIEDFSKKQISNIKNIVNGKVEKAKEESQVQDSIETNFKNKLSLSTKRQDYLKNKQKNYSQVIQNIKLVNHNSKSSRNNNIITPIRIHKPIPTESSINKRIIRKIDDDQIIDIPLIPFNKSSIEIDKKKPNIEKRLIELEFFTKKKFDELVNEIKNFIPIHFNSYVKDYNIVDSSNKKKEQSRQLSLENESKKVFYSQFERYIS